MAEPPQHLLILSCYFPPSPAAGAQRIQNLVELALEKGWQVTVVTMDEGQGKNCPLSVPNKSHDKQQLRVYKLKHLTTLQTKAKANASSSLSDKNYFRASFWILYKKFLLALNSRLIRYRFTKVAKGIVISDAPTMMISSAPPFIVHEVALELKKSFPELFWQADFRDPWVYPGSVNSVDELPENMSFKKVLCDADKLIAVTHGHYEFLQMLSFQVSRSAEQVVLVPNGTRIDLYEKVPLCQMDGGGIHIGHLGDITYTHRNPKSLIYALANLKPHYGQVAMHFWAEITPYTRWNGESINDMISATGMTESLFIHEFVPRQQAHSFQKSLDLLILFALNQPVQIPSKAYEYLVADKPILAICEKESETCKLLSQFDGVFFSTDNSQHRVSQALDLALAYTQELKQQAEDVKVGRKNLALLAYQAGFEKILAAAGQPSDI